MAMEIRHTARRTGMGRTAAIGLAMNIFVFAILVVLINVKFPELDPVPMIAMLAFIFLVVNLVGYLGFRGSEKDLLDTLSVDIILDKGDSDERTHQYETIVKLVEGNLVRNRITFDARFEGHRFGGPIVPYSRAFFLRTYGLTLKVKRDKIGRFAGVASVIIGPVSGPEDTVARKLLSGLRDELLRSETKDRPEKKS